MFRLHLLSPKNCLLAHFEGTWDAHPLKDKPGVEAYKGPGNSSNLFGSWVWSRRETTETSSWLHRLVPNMGRGMAQGGPGQRPLLPGSKGGATSNTEVGLSYSRQYSKMRKSQWEKKEYERSKRGRRNWTPLASFGNAFEDFWDKLTGNFPLFQTTIIKL